MGGFVFRCDGRLRLQVPLWRQTHPALEPVRWAWCSAARHDQVVDMVLAMSDVLSC
jgi:hypothetical protein